MGSYPKKRTLAVASAMLAMSLSTGLRIDRVEKPAPRTLKKKTKPCLQCGTEHNHNNAWCSSTCCKKWRIYNK